MVKIRVSLNTRTYYIIIIIIIIICAQIFLLLIIIRFLYYYYLYYYLVRRMTPPWNTLWHESSLVSIEAHKYNMKLKIMFNLMIPLAALAFVASAASAGPAASNFRPIIGVVSEPVVPENQQVSGKKPTSYIAASYVKYLEMAGRALSPSCMTSQQTRFRRYWKV